MKELARLLTEIDTWECSGSSEIDPDVDPKVEEFQRLLAQIDISQKKLSKSDPEAM